MNNAMRNFVSKNKELILTFPGYALVYANLAQSEILQGRAKVANLLWKRRYR